MPKNRYILVFAGCLGLALLVQTGIALVELFGVLNNARSSSLRVSDKVQKSAENVYKSVDQSIAESLRKVSGMSFPEYLRVHALYDSSAKRALLDLRAALRTKGVSLPLIHDKITVDTPVTPPKICVSVATARRKGAPFSYLTQSISALLNRMNYAKYKDDVYLHVFNVDKEPEKHVEVDWIRDLIPVTNLKVPIEPNGDFPTQPHYHENMDTAYIVRQFHRIGCDYPILIEDDALATTNWVDSIMDMIEDVSTGRYSRTDWLGVRLFVARSYYPALTSRGVNNFDPMFNMVAILLRREYMLAFADAMEEKVRITMQQRNHDLHLPKDLVLDQFKTNHGLRVLAYEPVIFQHTGVYSSVSNRTVDESSVNTWIMFSKYFEAAGEPIRYEETFW